jgi:hypothetical protein
MIIGALILHIIPVTMLVLGKPIAKNESISMRLNKNRHKWKANAKNLTMKNEESQFRNVDITSASYDFYPDIKYPSDVLVETEWKNPSNYYENSNYTNDDHFLENLDANRVMNSDGVEILTTIHEIDEEEIKAPEDVNNERDQMNLNLFAKSGMDDIHMMEEIRRKEIVIHRCAFVYAIRRFMVHNLRAFSSTFNHQIAKPLRRSLMIFRFYPSVLLKSIDIFSYLLFVMFIMPNQAMRMYRVDERENIVYLITFMGFIWIIYSLLVLKFHKSLKHSCIHYFHFLGILAKFFGYLRK